MWLILLCHNSIFVSTLRLLAYMAVLFYKADSVRIENKHSAFSPSSSDELAVLFYKADSVVEMNLHALLHNLANRDQIFCYCSNVQDILDVIVVSLVERNIADMPNGVCDVVYCLHVAGSIGCMQITEPLFVRRPVI